MIYFPCILREIQVLLKFRRHGLSGSLDSLGQFRAYSMSPCRILGPMTLFPGDMQELAIFGRL
jgi:hypothetical protein